MSRCARLYIYHSIDRSRRLVFKPLHRAQSKATRNTCAAGRARWAMRMGYHWLLEVVFAPGPMKPDRVIGGAWLYPWAKPTARNLWEWGSGEAAQGEG